MGEEAGKVNLAQFGFIQQAKTGLLDQQKRLEIIIVEFHHVEIMPQIHMIYQTMYGSTMTAKERCGKILREEILSSNQLKVGYNDNIICF